MPLIKITPRDAAAIVAALTRANEDDRRVPNEQTMREIEHNETLIARLQPIARQAYDPA